MFICKLSFFLLSFTYVDITHFLCVCFSTTDTGAERQALKENVYPKLREFCRENYGLEFQVTMILISHLTLSAKQLMFVSCHNLGVIKDKF